MVELKIKKPDELPELLGEFGYAIMKEKNFPDWVVVDWGVSEKVRLKIGIRDIAEIHDEIMNKIKEKFNNMVSIVPFKSKYEFLNFSNYVYKIRYLVIYIYKLYPSLWPTYHLKINLNFSDKHLVDLIEEEKEKKEEEKKIEELVLTASEEEFRESRVTLEIEGAALMWSWYRLLTPFLNPIQAKIVGFYYSIFSLMKYQEELKKAYEEGFKKLWEAVIEVFEKYKI